MDSELKDIPREIVLIVIGWIFSLIFIIIILMLFVKFILLPIFNWIF